MLEFLEELSDLARFLFDDFELNAFSKFDALPFRAYFVGCMTKSLAVT